MRHQRICLVIAAAAVALAIAGCGKKSSADAEGYRDIGKTFEDSSPSQGSEAPEGNERKPIEGIDRSELSEEENGRFEKLVDSLPSPCGKAHSLRTSKNSDPSCTRAPFALKYLVALLADGASDEDIRELYHASYQKKEPQRGFKLDGVPHKGPEDGQVVLVEFYAYTCPACAQFKPVLDEAVAAFPQDVVLFYKQFPLAGPGHEASQPAAQAALAAHQQGKFSQMHDLLFADPRKEKLRDHARSLGLDMKKFDADFAAMEKRVRDDKAEGESAGVAGTPTLYVNGRTYLGLDVDPVKYLKLRIEEALVTGE